MGRLTPAPSLEPCRTPPGGRAGTALRTALAAVSLLLLLIPAAWSAATTPEVRGARGAPVGAAPVIPASRAAVNVAIIPIRGPIDSIMERSVKRRIASAAESGADAIVFQLNTPGGEVGAVLEICRAIKQSPVPNTVAWVNAQAYSGGALIALACREIIVADAAVMGDALPIVVGPLGIQSLSDAERQKIMSPLLTEVVASARERGYDEYLVQGFVSTGVELWLVESKAEPGRFYFVDRSEYRILFGTEPAETAPVIPSARGGPRGATGALPPEAPGLPGTIRPRHRGAPVDPGVSPALPPASGPTQFRPASPDLQPLGDQISLGLAAATRRPVFSEADRGQWRLVERVTDGRGIVTLDTELMFRYGFAVRAATPRGTVNTEAELRDFFNATRLARIDESAVEVIARLLSNIILRGILLVVFVVCLFLELMNTGAIIPGALAALALIGLAAPTIALGLEGWWGPVSVLTGVGLILLEIFVLPGFGIFGVGGLLMLFAGLVVMFIPGGNPFGMTSQERTQLLTNLTTFLVGIGISIGLIVYLGRNFGSLPVLRRLILTGQGAQTSELSMLEAMGPQAPAAIRPGVEGITTTPLRPAGKMKVGEDLYDVVAVGAFIDAGVPVRIVEVTPFRIAVERVGGPGTV
jgi:membrane-bound ClpP family serine protease